MENYYDILEVSEKASNEVIEKAYKVLVKKYHPDLQQPQNKSKAEEMMKKINEAYGVLIDPEKRAEYDEMLKRKRQEEADNQKNNYIRNEYEQQNNYETTSEQIKDYTNENQNNYEEEYRRKLQEQLDREAYERQVRNEKYEQKYRQKMQEQLNQEYQNAYYNYLRSLGYKIKEKWTWKKTLILLEVIVILAVAITALWFFPPTNKLLVAFYEGNPIVKWVVDAVVMLAQAIWTSIYSLFTNPPKI